ncbi:MAG: hypothetical protein N4A48_03755 [Tepidibacter sp.]|jgi:alpha-tubulin suppressor-like RCC1 family protein|uniref:RCC1 domain-containing protein n=1 Tax=Tepidibacter sp. TaxID=2529387 RepID=UPI0025F13EA5|nr:hypothetical protein [Tepidibacter sp.]MCT4507864.1 hypothetical protein [Tepidibacter sp.]
MKRFSVIIMVIILLISNMEIIYGEESKNLKFTSISAGSQHVLVIESGNIWYWGSNRYGKLGNGTKKPNSTPLKISGTGDWKSVEAGRDYSLALKKDGTLWGWGLALSSEDNYKNYINKPIKLSEDKWKMVSAGSVFFIGIKEDNSIWKGCVYDKDYNVQPYMRITQIGFSKDWKDISVGDNHALLIKKDGTLWSYGQSNNGALGLGEEIQYAYELPIQVGQDKNWIKIHAGWSESIALKKDDSLWSWGFVHNRYIFKPTKIEEKIEYIDLDTYGHITYVDKKNTVWTYSGPKYITPTDYPYKRRKVEGIKDVISIENGTRFSVALDRNGNIWTWGDNETGELGYGKGCISYSPIQIGTSNKWEKIYGKNSTVHGGIKEDNSLWVWGNSYVGRLGYAGGVIPMKMNEEKIGKK